jgi:hypothetical protein
VWTALWLEWLGWELGAQAHVPGQPPLMKLVHKDITFESVPASCFDSLPAIHAWGENPSWLVVSKGTGNDLPFVQLSYMDRVEVRLVRGSEDAVHCPEPTSPSDPAMCGGRALEHAQHVIHCEQHRSTVLVLCELERLH